MMDAMRTPVRTDTVETFWSFCQQPVNAGRCFELIEGVIHEMPPTGGEHGEVGGDLFGLIWTHNRQHKLGRVTNAETGYILWRSPDGNDTVRAPDIGFVSFSRAPQPFGKGFIPMPPDLAVEIISPHDSDSEVEQKVKDYLRAGTRLVWLVYPALKAVVVHRPDGQQNLYAADTLDGGDVLPGFNIAVHEIFPK